MLSDHKVAIITGITGGIGKAIAIFLAKDGINLVGASRNEEKMIEVLEEINLRYKVDCLAVPTDVSKNEQVHNMVTKTVEKFSRIDILINNAGVGAFDYIIDSKLEDWQKMIDVNLKGVYLCSRAVLSQMMRQKNGKVINISSICGLRGYSKGGAYCASKFGVVGLTEVLAQEVKPYNIKVFAVCPGIVDTSFANNINPTLTDKSHMLKPQDVAGLVFSLINSGDDSQICEISLKPSNIFNRILRKKGGGVVVKIAKYL